MTSLVVMLCIICSVSRVQRLLNHVFIVYLCCAYLVLLSSIFLFFFSSRRRHTRFKCDWSQTCALPILCTSMPRLLTAARNACEKQSPLGKMSTAKSRLRTI